MANDPDPTQPDTDAIHKVRDGVLRLQNLQELIRIEQTRGEDEPDERLGSE